MKNSFRSIALLLFALVALPSHIILCSNTIYPQAPSNQSPQNLSQPHVLVNEQMQQLKEQYQQNLQANFEKIKQPINQITIAQPRSSRKLQTVTCGDKTFHYDISFDCHTGTTITLGDRTLMAPGICDTMLMAGGIINGTGIILASFLQYDPGLNITPESCPQTDLCGQCYLQAFSFNGNCLTGSALFHIGSDGSLTPIIFPGGSGNVIDGTKLLIGLLSPAAVTICGQCYIQGIFFEGDVACNKFTGSALWRVEEYDGSLTPIIFPGGYGNVIDGNELLLLSLEDSIQTNICGQCYLRAITFTCVFNPNGDLRNITGSALWRVENDGSLNPIIFSGGTGNTINGTGLIIGLFNCPSINICGQCYLQGVFFEGNLGCDRFTGSGLWHVNDDGSLTPIIVPGGYEDVIDGTGLLFSTLDNNPSTNICDHCYLQALTFNGVFALNDEYTNITGSALFRTAYDGSLDPVILPGGTGDVIDGTGLIISLRSCPTVTICDQCYLQGIFFQGELGDTNFIGSGLWRVESNGYLKPIIALEGYGDVINGTGLFTCLLNHSNITICDKCYFQAAVVDPYTLQVIGSALWHIKNDGSFCPVMFPGGNGNIIDGTNFFPSFSEIDLCGHCYLQGLSVNNSLVLHGDPTFTGYALWRVDCNGMLTPELLPNGQHAPSTSLLNQLLCQAAYGFPEVVAQTFPFCLLITTLQSNNVDHNYLCNLTTTAGINPTNCYLSCGPTHPTCEWSWRGGRWSKQCS